MHSVAHSTPNGFATFNVARGASPALAVTMQLDLTNGTDQVTGTVTDGSWTAQLQGYREATSISTPTPGKYTVAFIGSGDGITEPGGSGVGLITVASTGTVSLSGTLSDTTAIAPSTKISKDGQWPLYSSFNSGGGLLTGWIIFTNDTVNNLDLEGSLTWIKPASSSPYYPFGFDMSIDAAGSALSVVSGAPALTASNGIVVLSGSTLTTPLTNSYSMNSHSVITITTNHSHLTLTLTSSTGAVVRQLQQQQHQRLHPHQGCAASAGQVAHGFFYTTGRSGDFLMQ